MVLRASRFNFWKKYWHDIGLDCCLCIIRLNVVAIFLVGLVTA